MPYKIWTFTPAARQARVDQLGLLVLDSGALVQSLQAVLQTSAGIELLCCVIGMVCHVSYSATDACEGPSNLLCITQILTDMAKALPYSVS